MLSCIVVYCLVLSRFVSCCVGVLFRFDSFLFVCVACAWRSSSFHCRFLFLFVLCLLALLLHSVCGVVVWYVYCCFVLLSDRLVFDGFVLILLFRV